MHRIVLLFCLSAVFLKPGFSAEITLHVSTGTDGDGETHFNSVEQSIERARALRKKDPATAVSIALANGRYELSKPLQFGNQDSGISEALPFQILAEPSATPVLSGGRIIQGFSKIAANSNLWQVQIKAVQDHEWYFSDLFINGKRARRARTPNTGFFRVEGPSPTGKTAKIKSAAGVIKKEWVEAGDVELIALLAWADLRMQIVDFDEVTRLVTLKGDAKPSNQENNARYYIENARDALDEAGEFYLDRKSGILSYLARDGEDLTKAEVIAPLLRDLVSVQGDFAAKKPVEHIVFRGITFSDTAWSLPEAGYADTQAAVSIRGNFLAEGVVDLRLENCKFMHLAGYAVELGKGAQSCKISGNEIVDMGAGGIRVGEGVSRSDRFEQNFGHFISNNEIHDCGLVYPSAIGVFIMQSGTNRVAHNHIHHLYYTAVSVGWNWGYQETPCHDNIIESNDLHDIGQGMLSDMGAIYTLGIQKGTIVRNNRIHDVQSFSYGGWGLYPDEGSSNILWENNLVYRCKSAGFHQHYGKDNIVRNNIFALNLEHQLMRSREEDHRSFIFTNNIVYFDSGGLLGSTWTNDHFIMESNVYFDARPSATPASFRFGQSTFEQWKARGHDTNSVIADPLFISPASGDFRLRKESPALRLGFKPLDLDSVGPVSVGSFRKP